jgi:DNA-binding CsgD family transcriptional regulator
MSRQSTWAGDGDAQIRKFAADGLTAREAAGIIGCTRNAVLGRAHRIGVSFPLTPRKKASNRRGRPAKPLPPRVAKVGSVKERNAEIAKRFAAGETAPQLAHAFSLTPQSVWNILCLAGVRRGQQPSRKGVAVGERVYPRSVQLTAVAAVLAGASYKTAAQTAGCRHQIIRKSWMKDAGLVAEARGIAEAATAKARAAAEQRFAERRAAENARREKMDAWNAGILARLPVRHADIIRTYFELGTLQLAGDRFGITRERVRQIVAKAEAKGLIRDWRVFA